MTINKYRSSLLRAAKESLEESLYADVPASTDADLAQGDVLSAGEETAALACEALNAEAGRLERLFTAIKDIPSGKATPELITAVQATTTAEVEPSIANESEEETKSRWEKVKGQAGKALDATVEAAKKAAKWLMDMLNKFIDWIFTTRRGTQRKLQEAKAGLAKAKDRVDVKNEAKLKPLTYKDSFGAQAFKTSMQRYAAVATAFHIGLENAMTITGTSATAVFDLNKQFVIRSGAVLKWHDQKAQLYDGEGGKHVELSFDDKGMLHAEAGDLSTNNDESGGGSVKTSSATFTRDEAGQVIDMGLALLKGLDKLEPPLKKIKENLNAMDFSDMVTGRQNKFHSGEQSKSLTEIIMVARAIVTVAANHAIKPVLEAAHAAGNFAEAFIGGKDIEEEEQKPAGQEGKRSFAQPQLAN